ncbi:MAG: mechanosensitive ion channel [Verrucomicrobiae bacterium]|nr:mechanosensitive ion channel [Verrucomicrobiae bacterium]MCP5550422.1 mechanosensitive ion channel [Akkermansiaceae bacterium]
MLSRFTESRLADARDIPPAVRVLAAKFTNFFLILAAIGFTLAVVGIDLTALTVFGGALGLGIGFGLQKVVSNLISGVILLLDKSIKPGDVIEIGDTYGRINGLRTRYVSVVTRDNKEHLIPNEDLITQPVINWSFTDRLVRLRAPIGIAYGSDVRLAIDLCEKAAAASPRVRKSPEPKCLLRGFGDSSVDLELRFFIEDPSEGCANVTSDVLLAVWDAFHEHGIEIPFPQRDLHLRSGGEVLREIFVKNPGAD